MKRHLIYLATLLAAAVACNKEILEETPAPALAEGEVKVCLTGHINVPTKVEFDADGKFSWSSSDKIAVHAADGLRNGIVMAESEYKTGAVVPDATDPSTCSFYVVMSEAQPRDFYAVYPASVVDEENYGDPELKIILPSSYEIGPEGMGDYSPTPMIAVNDPSSSDLDFNHVGGLLRIALYDVAPGTAAIEVSLDKRISGSFTVNDLEDPSSAGPSIVTDDNADAVTFHFTEPLSDYVDGLVLNVPVPSGKYNSLTVSAKNSGGETTFAYEDSKPRIFDPSRGRQVKAIISAVAIPLCFESVDGGSVTFENPVGLTIEYSTDNIFWTASSDANLTIPVAEGGCVYFRGNNASYFDFDALMASMTMVYCHFTLEGHFYIYGNIMSLIQKEDFEYATELTGVGNFVSMFKDNEGLMNHPTKNLELPATTLTMGCYANLFDGCSGLTRAFALPATVLQQSCYDSMYRSTGVTSAVEILADEIPSNACSSMYNGCTELAYAPDFHASVVGSQGCHSMFYNCYSLVSAPALPASVVGDYGYDNMFYNCIALATPPALGATTIGKGSFDSMFKGCSALTTAPSLGALTSIPNNACYEMFYGCTSLTDVPDLGGISVGENGCRGMFKSCFALTKAPALPATSVGEYGYYDMFRDCISLTEAPDLPATSAASCCYESMFYGCTALPETPVISAPELGNDSCSYMFYKCSSLTTAHNLPATKIGNGCYSNMFHSCTALIETPEISATEIGESSCNSMFAYCTSLTTAHKLPAATLANLCYDFMFAYCTSLTTPPELPATTLAPYCYRQMFLECKSLTESPFLPALELVPYCYSSMFKDCSNLSKVTALFLTNPYTPDERPYHIYTYSWLSGTKTYGTFVMHPDATWVNSNNRGSDGIPRDWQIVRANLGE